MHIIGQPGVKLSLLEDNVKISVEIPKKSTKNLSGLINEFSKFAGYEVNIQK